MTSDEDRSAQEECAISRAVDGTASDADWDHLELLAASDRGVWERLAQSMRIEAALHSDFDQVLEQVESLDLRPRSPARLLVMQAAGWAAALVVAVLWWATAAPRSTSKPALPTEHSPVVATDSRTALEAPATTLPEVAQALNHYLELGREAGVIRGELAPQVLATEAGANPGALSVVFIRRIVEQAEVDRFLQWGVDDQGRIASVPASDAPFRALESF